MKLNEDINSLISERAVNLGYKNVEELKQLKNNIIINATGILKELKNQYKKFENTGVYIATPEYLKEEYIIKKVLKINGVEFYDNEKEYRIA